MLQNKGTVLSSDKCCKDQIIFTMYLKRAPAPTNTVIALLLAVMVLFAQWAGLTHRVAHAQLPYGQQLLSQVTSHVLFQDNSSSQDSGSAHHSCAIYDAATFADTVPNPVFIPALPRNTPVLTQLTAMVPRHVPFRSYFCPRAPPA
jgi:hypothetical protein